MMNRSSGNKSAIRSSRVTLVVFAAAVFVLSLGSARTVRATPTPVAKGDSQAGGQVFLQKCLQCHSVAEGETRVGPSLYHELKKPGAKKTDAEVRLIIKNGKNKMPAWGAILSQEDTNNLLAYLHSL